MHTISTPINSRADPSVLLKSTNLTRQVMSSREISELVEARHNDVLATIERLFSKGLLRSPRKSRREATGGRPIEVYDLIERDTHLVVSGYSDEHRARVIDRWQELEDQASRQFAVPSTLPEALRLAADQAEENERLIGVIQLQAPKVAAIKRLAAAHGAVCLTDAAKLLQVKPRQFVEWMVNRDWLYQRGNRKRLTAKQDRIDQGYMTHKFTELKANELTGETKAVPQPLVTPKGMARLAEMLQEAL